MNGATTFVGRSARQQHRAPRPTLVLRFAHCLYPSSSTGATRRLVTVLYWHQEHRNTRSLLVVLLCGVLCVVCCVLCVVCCVLCCWASREASHRHLSR